MVRAFIAVELTPEIQEALRACQRVLAGSRAKLTLVDPAIIHITIKFLGEVPEPAVAKIRDALGPISLAPFDLSITRITGNDPRRPRVVWAAVEDGGGCSALHARIEAALAPLGIPRDGRPFRPHATLARVRSFDPSLLERIRAVPPGPPGICRVSGFALKKSTLTPQGPVYENILEVAW
jgi:2'-5' RNA ligase